MLVASVALGSVLVTPIQTPEGFKHLPRLCPSVRRCDGSSGMLLCLGDFLVEGLGEGWGCRFRFEVIMWSGPRTPSIMPGDGHTAVEGGRGSWQEQYRTLAFLCSGRAEQRRGGDLFQDVGG